MEDSSTLQIKLSTSPRRRAGTGPSLMTGVRNVHPTQTSPSGCHRRRITGARRCAGAADSGLVRSGFPRTGTQFILMLL